MCIFINHSSFSLIMANPKKDSIANYVITGFITGAVAGSITSLMNEPNNELISLSLESILPGSAVLGYSIVDPIANDKKPSFGKSVVVTGATMASYIATRILYS